MISDWRTARCTVTAASNWLSLLSRLTSERLSARLAVRGPGVPVGVAQPTSEPSEMPAPRASPDRSRVLLENGCCKGDLVIIDLSTNW